VLEEAAEELVAAVEQGTVAVSTAADITGFTKEEQKEIVARGEAEILKAAEVRVKRAGGVPFSGRLPCLFSICRSPLSDPLKV
jgi:hypothetical protein